MSFKSLFKDINKKKTLKKHKHKAFKKNQETLADYWWKTKRKLWSNNEMITWASFFWSAAFPLDFSVYKRNQSLV